MDQRKREDLASLREVLGVLWTHASRFVRLRLVAALLLVAASSAATALGPVLLKGIVDRLTEAGGGAQASVPLALTVPALVALYVASQWIARILGELRSLVYARAERRMRRTLSEQLFEHVMALPMRFHFERQTGALTQALASGLQGFHLVLYACVFTMLPVVVEMATIIVVLIRVAPPVFLLLFTLALTCYAVAFACAASRIREPARSVSEAEMTANASITDSLMHAEIVKLFTAEPVMAARAGTAFRRTEAEWVRFYQRFAANGIAVATVFATFLCVTVWLASRQTIAGAITLGTFVLVNTYMLQIVRPVEMFGNGIQNFVHGLAYLEKMVALLREPPEALQGSSRPRSPGPGQLEFQSVSLSYHRDRPILKDVTFQVPAGKTVALVGASGSGKSSLVRLLLRLVEPSSGRILLDGVPVTEMPLTDLRQTIAVVPQDTVLFAESIAYNIAFGRPGVGQSEIEEAARIAHLHEFVNKLPQGYGTQVGERGVKLSGGEQQRVSIARAALKQPRIYVFDEPTSSLDSHTEQEILRNLNELSRRRTTLVIAHRLSTIAGADEIVVLDQGVIVEQGTHGMLLKKGGAYASLWRTQHAVANLEPPVAAHRRG